MEYVLLPLGLAILLIGGKLLIENAVKLVSYLKVSPLVIGITIVSFGTSAPEIFISIIAAFKNSSDIVVSNIVGSNIANIGLILGFTALLIPIPVKRVTMQKDIPILLIISVLLLLSFLNASFDWWEGLFFLLLLISYLYWLIKDSPEEFEKNIPKIKKSKINIFKVLLILIISIICLYWGAELLINNAKTIARNFGISERVIGLSLIAFGTSIPELITSVLAALKREMEISVGNIIGSNIYNIGAALGITSFIHPISIHQRIVGFDIFYMLGITSLLILLLSPFHRMLLKRPQGVILLLCYFFYIYLIF